MLSWQNASTYKHTAGHLLVKFRSIIPNYYHDYAKIKITNMNNTKILSANPKTK